MKNFGFKLPEIQDGDYIMGGFGSLPKVILQPTGQWDLVGKENQNLFGVETHACTSYGTLSAIEIILKKLYGTEENFSDRWLAWNTGIDWRKGGTDPQRTIETLRKGGVPKQEYWDFTSDIKTPDDFYKNPPPKLIEQARVDFLNPYLFKHEYISTGVESIKEALKYSPVAMSVSAWFEKDGIYYSPEGIRNNHWVCCYGYDDEKKAWKIFDSYENNLKLYSYDSLIQVAKRFYIEKNVEVKKKISLIQTIISLSQTALTLLQDLLKKTMEEELKTPSNSPKTAPVSEEKEEELQWDTKEKSRHSCRVIMDRFNLKWLEKDLLCAVIEAESNFNIKAFNDNGNSQDYGIAQINSFWWIGEGKYFKSVEEVLNNPEKSIVFMVEQYLKGHLNYWCAFTNKSYKRYL